LYSTVSTSSNGTGYALNSLTLLNSGLAGGGVASQLAMLPSPLYDPDSPIESGPSQTTACAIT